MRRKVWLVPLAVIVAIALGYLAGWVSAWSLADAVDPHRATSARRITAQTARSAGVPESPARAPAPIAPRAKRRAAPLPRPGTALAQTYDDLAGRARSGDVAAASRLFADLQHCKARARHMQSVDTASRQLQALQQQTDGSAERARYLEYTSAAAAKELDQLDASDDLCRGVTIDQIAGRGEWLLEAAQAGDGQAIVCYIFDPEDFGPDFMADEWFDWARRWRVLAPELAQQAFAQADPRILPLLEDAFSPSAAPRAEQRQTVFPLGQIVSPDSLRAYEYALLWQRAAKPTLRTHVSGMLDRLGSELTAQQRADARDFADREWPRFAPNVGDGVGYGFDDCPAARQ